MERRTLYSLSALVAVLLIASGFLYFSEKDESELPQNIIVAAGDIGMVVNGAQQKTAALVQSLHPEKVLILGDAAYGSSSYDDFMQLYDPSWGQFKNITAPSPGNHEYFSPRAEGYFTYFGSLAGKTRGGYYSYDLGSWHLISLNSEAITQDQLNWLANDLSATHKECILAYWHRPLFSSGEEHGNYLPVRIFWDLLHKKGVDLVLSAHGHNYERFDKQDPEGEADKKGIRQFVVGTGGAQRAGFFDPKANSAVRNSSEYGVLLLTLKAHSYDAEFKALPGSKFTDKIEGQWCNPKKNK